MCGSSSEVEHNLAKVGVEGSNPFFRSIFFTLLLSCHITVRYDLDLCMRTQF